VSSKKKITRERGGSCVLGKTWRKKYLKKTLKVEKASEI